VDIVAHRLRNQKLIRTDRRTPEEVVASLGAMQAQDYAGARWAIGLRTRALTDRDVECAYDEGRILRTHILRPTWHFVTPADIRWMLGISGPRVHAVNGPSYRKNGVDDETVRKSRSTIAKVLGKGAHLTRPELASALARAGIPAAAERLAYLMMRAELDGVICSGARRGNQFTYALLDERAPRISSVKRDEALAMLATRYFTSHGPATLRDYAWWSGLTVRDAKSGIEAAGQALFHATVDGRGYWSTASQTTIPRPTSSLYLLPNYDEYLIAYKDRETVKDNAGRTKPILRPEFPHFLVVDGKLRGTWKRTLSARNVIVTVRLFRPLTTTERRALDSVAIRYGRFINQPVTLEGTR
jgi:DNA glycosylase AlkZ-like